MRRPMPSPKNSNHARLFIGGSPRAAYDAMPDDKAAELIMFLQKRLSEADFQEACRLGKLDAGIVMDDENGGPEPFSGMPQRFGQDSRRRRAPMTPAQEADFNRRYPHAAKIKVSS